jgi:FecR protein
MARRSGIALAVLAVTALSVPARGDDATPGYPERVLQWTTKNGESCDDIAAALYGDAKHRALVERYNAVRCLGKKPLPDGLTLVVPAKVTDLPTARLRAMHPDVREKPPGGAWAPAASGMPLYQNYSVNTLSEARADILFVDRTRVVLAEHTLVVIYGTAKQTAVSKTPPTVELDSGEVQAGLAALRGKPVEVAAQNGHVTVRSRESAVRSKGSRATVSVFDGSASVASAGTKVEVGKNLGTAYLRDRVPEPPRPLPPAPEWTSASAGGVILAPPGEAVVTASWKPAQRAAAYRVELARDAEFTDLIAREEAPPKVRAFRAEKLPPGAYFLRVRVIDQDDFLGIASPPRSVIVAGARLSGTPGRVEPGRIEASRYGFVELAGFDGLELAVDGGPFGKVPLRIDLLRLAPKELGFRLRGSGDVTRYQISYLEPEVTIATARAGANAIDFEVKLSRLEGVDVAARVAPVLRIRRGEAFERVALVPSADSVWTARLAGESLAGASVEVVDSRGRVLAQTEIETGEASESSSAHRQGALPSPIGVTAPPLQPSPLSNVVWWAPTPESSGAASSTGYFQDSRAGALLAVRASGRLGGFGFDGRVLSRELAGAPADSSAWFTLRWRPAQIGRIELGPAVELGVPLAALSPPARVGMGLAFGGRAEHVTWLANVGGRALVAYDSSRRAAPDAQGFLLGGATYDLTSWLRSYALLDAHALVHPDTDAFALRGGLSLGAEVGASVFGGVALRASPWDDDSGHVMGQLSIGVRERR